MRPLAYRIVGEVIKTLFASRRPGSEILQTSGLLASHCKELAYTLRINSEAENAEYDQSLLPTTSNRSKKGGSRSEGFMHHFRCKEVHD